MANHHYPPLFGTWKVEGNRHIVMSGVPYAPSWRPDFPAIWWPNCNLGREKLMDWCCWENLLLKHVETIVFDHLFKGGFCRLSLQFGTFRCWPGFLYTVVIYDFCLHQPAKWMETTWFPPIAIELRQGWYSGEAASSQRPSSGLLAIDQPFVVAYGSTKILVGSKRNHYQDQKTYS